MDVTPLDGVLPAGQDSGQQTTLSRFNGWGQRFLRDTPNAQSVFSYGTEGFNLLSETTRNLSTSALSTTEHIWLPTASGPMPIAAVIDGVHYAVHADHLNTPRRLTDGSQAVKWQWPYSGFGEITPQSTPAAGQAPVNYSLRYPGQIDDGNGLFYNWHRFYDPRVGRYTKADPIGLEGGWNRFGYVGGNPLGFVDPEGLRRSFGSGNARDRRFDRRHRPARPPGHKPSDSWQDAAGYFDEDGDFVCLRWRCTNNSFDPNCSAPTFGNTTTNRRYSEFTPNATNPKEPPMGCTCDTPAWRDSKSPGYWELEDWADFLQKAHKRSKAR